MNKAAQAYFQTKVSTTDQGQLLLMLYDGALNYLKQARDKMLAKDFAAKGILLSKVIDIVSELSASLNMEKGGSLAVNLNNLYLLCTARLLQANLKMNVESLDSVVHILSGLRSAYAQILENPEARKATAEIAERMQPAGSITKTAQPIMQGVTSAIPRGRAQALYGKSAMQPAVAAAVASGMPLQVPTQMSAAPAALAQATAPVSATAPPVSTAASASTPPAHTAAPTTIKTMPAASVPPQAPAATPTAAAPAEAHTRAKVQAFAPSNVPASATAPISPISPISPIGRRMPGAYTKLTSPGNS